MAKDRSNARSEGGKVKRIRAAASNAKAKLTNPSIDVERSGDWMPACELRDAALRALEAGGDLTLNLNGIGHLDASALQILLAFDAEQKKRGHELQLLNKSDSLQKWFEFAGAGDYFSQAERIG